GKSPCSARSRWPRNRANPCYRRTLPMIIVLRPDSTTEQIDHVLERIQELGLKPHLSRGEHRTIIGVIGDENKLQTEPLAALPGGAFKPRTSPYSFQGLGEEGLRILRDVGKKHDLPVVTEVMDPRQVELVERYTDMFQIGARNMQNFDLLKEVGQTRKPVLLKRGMSATVKDLLMSAEYILAEGNHQVVLCERGVRSFEDSTRNMLDLSAV